MPALGHDSPIQFVKGIGPHRAESFAALGIHTVGDLLEYFPFRHELDQGEVAIEDLSPGAHVTVRGEIVRLGGRPPTLRCEINDGTGICVLRWFNQRLGGQGLSLGLSVIAQGRVQVYGGRPELVQPRIQVFNRDALLLKQPSGPRQVGVYRGNDTLKSPLIRRAVLNVLSQARLPVEDVLPPRLRNKHELPMREEAVRQMHNPTSAAELARARMRLAYEELLLLELAMALRRRKRLAVQTGRKLHVTAEIDARIRARFPFPLTDAQDQAVHEIAADLQSGAPMTRLLQGDVGCGKTVVALYACLVAVAHGKQAALMAPTEILAHQHYANIRRYLSDSRVRFMLLRGKLKAQERAATLAAIERGEIDLVVGTQALIQKDVAFDQLALVIVDEQHKFGVLQRHEFRTKGPMPHYLVMTATPIPRTLALTVFGDLDVSLIKQSPPGRGSIVTKVVRAPQWGTVMGHVRQRLERGEQAYVVCPQIGADDATALEASPGTGLTVAETHDRLVNGPWRGLKVGLLHGGLRSADKQATIAAFAAGQLHAVVATTVVEVGVDVPSATVMVIEHAERYGLSQLHQLRGRVGRGSRDSLCVLIARDQSDKADERLAVMARTTDGFEIAEADLRQRGPGELFGTRQHGLPELRVASIVDDFGLVEQARQDAFDMVGSDPTLQAPEHQPLYPALRRLFGEQLALIDAA